MKVLVACEESQRVCIAFRERGHEAYSCDIQECSGGHPEWHIKQDVLTILNSSKHMIGCPNYPEYEDYIEFTTTDGVKHQIEDKWDLIIAHPPCTYLSRAGACRMFKVIEGKHYIDLERYNLMKQGKAFFNKFLAAKCDRICVENPLPLSICELPPPTQIIQPYEFGHPYSKRTLLWLKNLPLLKPTEIIQIHVPWLPSNTSNFSKGRGGSKGATHGQKNYSKTFPGIAKAMAEQWG